MIYLQIAQIIILVIILIQINSLVIFLKAKRETQVEIKFPESAEPEVKPVMVRRSTINCELCGEQLAWTAKRTKDGRWVCDRCRIVKLNQASVQ